MPGDWADDGQKDLLAATQEQRPVIGM